MGGIVTHPQYYRAPAPKRPAWFLPVVIAAGVLVMLVILGTVVTLAAGGTAARPAAVAPVDVTAQDDVEVVNCARDAASGWPAAALRITNHSRFVSTYSITVAFQDQAAGGTQYASGVAIAALVQPGQVATQTAQGLAGVPVGPLHCRVVSAIRTRS